MTKLARKQLPRWSIILILFVSAGILCFIFALDDKPTLENTTPDDDTMQRDRVEEATRSLPDADLEPSPNGLSKAELDILRKQGLVTDQERQEIQELEDGLHTGK